MTGLRGVSWGRIDPRAVDAARIGFPSGDATSQHRIRSSSIHLFLLRLMLYYQIIFFININRMEYLNSHYISDSV